VYAVRYDTVLETQDDEMCEADMHAGRGSTVELCDLSENSSSDLYFINVDDSQFLKNQNKLYQSILLQT
jgi:hypothetical protein